MKKKRKSVLSFFLVMEEGLGQFTLLMEQRFVIEKKQLIKKKKYRQHKYMLLSVFISQVIEEKHEEESKQVEEESIPADYDIENDPDCITSPIFNLLYR